MADAPERMYFTPPSLPDDSLAVEYVRADLYAALERERDEAQQNEAEWARRGDRSQEDNARLREAVRDCYTHAQEGLDRGQELDRLECIVIVANEALAGEW